MRLIMVRHGEPDYERDCLTARGRNQARAAAERLAGEHISEIYSSPNGRAKETASWTAERFSVPVRVLDYMHEVSWGGPGVPEGGHPWTLSDWLLADPRFEISGWRSHPFFADNVVLQYYDRIGKEIDLLLAGKGYRREGGCYRCENGSGETIALFSHGGSGACVLSHLLNLPFPYVLSVMPYDFTSVTILDFQAREGELIFPRLELFNDTAHMEPFRKEREGIALQQTSEPF